MVIVKNNATIRDFLSRQRLSVASSAYLRHVRPFAAIIAYKNAKLYALDVFNTTTWKFSNILSKKQQISRDYSWLLYAASNFSWLFAVIPEANVSIRGYIPESNLITIIQIYLNIV